jgi:hypothetical protein
MTVVNTRVEAHKALPDDVLFNTLARVKEVLPAEAQALAEHISTRAREASVARGQLAQAKTLLDAALQAKDDDEAWMAVTRFLRENPDPTPSVVQKSSVEQERMLQALRDVLYEDEHFLGRDDGSIPLGLSTRLLMEIEAILKANGVTPTPGRQR